MDEDQREEGAAGSEQVDPGVRVPYARKPQASAEDDADAAEYADHFARAIMQFKRGSLPRSAASLPEAGGSAQRAGGPPRPPQPQFSGRGKSGALAQELQTFVRRLEATFLLYPSDFSTDAQRVAYAEGFLQPPASEVWSVHAGLNYAEGSASWAQFTAFLLAQYGPSDPAFLALKNYLHIVQRGSLDGYITSFTSVLNAVLALPGGAQLVSNPSFVFYHGLVVEHFAPHETPPSRNPHASRSKKPHTPLIK